MSLTRFSFVRKAAFLLVLLVLGLFAIVPAAFADSDVEPMTEPQNGWVQNEDEDWMYFVNDVARTGWQKIGGKWYYFNDSGVKQTGIINDGGKYYYLNDFMKTGWQQVEGTWYYFSNAARTGWQKINNKWYYFDSSGCMQTGLLNDNGKLYFLQSNGPMATGWQQSGGSWYYFSNAARTGWQKIGGKWWYFDTNGVMHSGLLNDHGKLYYLHNSMMTGWQQVEGNWYYFSNAARTGWQKINNKWYWFDASGVMQTGAQTINGKRYHFQDNGPMVTGWAQESGKWYYFNSTPQVGWLKVSGIWYYLDPEDDGARVTDCFKVVAGKTYAFDGNGHMIVGWGKIAGKWYYFSNSSTYVTGWQTVDGKRYYFANDGVMQTGKIEVDGVTYILNSSGNIQPYTWIDAGGVSYMTDALGEPKLMRAVSDVEGAHVTDLDGNAVSGLIQIDNRLMATDESGQLLSGWQTVDDQEYYFDPISKVAAVGWVKIDDNWYYFNGEGAKQTGWVKDSGKWYYLNDEGIMQTGWLQTSDGTWYYLKPTGSMVANSWYTINGKSYYFDGSGKWVSQESIMTAKAQGYSSATGWLILVDLTKHRVAVFKGSKGNWKMEQYFVCANGALSTPTVVGQFTVGAKGYFFDTQDVRCFWYTQFYGNYLFHSTLYDQYTTKPDPAHDYDPWLDGYKSHGCVRLATSNAKWIYDNIPSGTKVVTYNS